MSCQTDTRTGETDALSKLLAATDMGEMLDIVKQKWNEKCYLKTKPGLGSPLETDCNTIFLVDAEEGANSWWKQKLAETFPQIRQLLIESRPSEGKIIRVSTEVSYEEINDGKAEKNIYLLGIKHPSEGGDEVANRATWTNIYEGIEQLIQREAQEGRGNIALCNTSNTDVVKIRRLTEKILQNISVTVTVYPKNTRRKKSVAHGAEIPKTAESKNLDTADSKKDPFSWTTVNRKKANTVVIKGVQAANYAEVLRNLKKEINVTNIGVKVNNISHDNKDEIHIKFYSDKTSEEKFLTEIKKNTEPHMETSVKKASRTVFIKDLNSTTIRADVIEAVKETLAVEEADIQEVEMAKKPNKLNQLYAFVKLPVDKANTLIDLRKIRCGWQLCRVEEINKPTICFNCYKYGHIAKTCKNESRAKACLRCAATDHDAKECKGEPRCINCTQKNDHVTFSFACPLYKKANMELRQNRRIT